MENAMSYELNSILGNLKQRLARKTHGMSKTKWEELSKKLQTALKDQIDECMENDIVIKDLMLIIHYLETKLGIYKWENDGN